LASTMEYIKNLFKNLLRGLIFIFSPTIIIFLFFLFLKILQIIFLDLKGLESLIVALSLIKAYVTWTFLLFLLGVILLVYLLQII